jgi:hypothetical protein
LKEIEKEHKLRGKYQNKKIVFKNVKKKAYMGEKNSNKKLYIYPKMKKKIKIEKKS